MTSGEKTVYLSLGSNLGDREDNLKKAVELLSEKVRTVKISCIYETQPFGVSAQPCFLNLALKASTALSPVELLAFVKQIESKLGRPPDTHNQPRPVDIDILFYGNEIINTPDFIIPHPRLTERAFVLVPFADIAPGLVHPETGRTVAEMLEAVSGREGVVKWEARVVEG